MTETIVVERSFETPTSQPELQAREAAVAWCLTQHGVSAVCSYLALDGRTAICVYRAPDAEAVRATQRQAGLPFDHAWTGLLRGVLVPTISGSTVIVQREFPAPVTMEFVEQTLSAQGHCLELHRAKLRSSHLARDGQRMICVFDAPDAESVRNANRQMRMPFTRAWPAQLFVAPPG